MPKLLNDLSKIVAYPISITQLLKPVLDDAYRRIPGSAADKDDAIERAIQGLKEQYRDLTTGEDVSYTPPEVRFAYLHRYVTSNASLVAEIIGRSPALRKLFERPEVEVVAIGGGPGSEVVGIAKHCAEQNAQGIITLNLYDRDPAWAGTWTRLHKKVNLPVKLFPTFIQFDARDRSTWEHDDAFADADLIAMVFFATEVFKHATKVRPFFRRLFKRAKRGALFLYIDNGTPTFNSWLDELTAGCGLERIDGNDCEVIGLGHWDQKSDFEEYVEKFGPPKIVARGVAWRVLRKK